MTIPSKRGAAGASRVYITEYRQKVLVYLVLVFLVFGVGTLGYMVLEGWGAFDAFYMTVITLATIGYGEVHELSTAGRVFTILLIFMGVGIGTVVLGSAWQAVVEGQFVRIFDRRRKVLEKVEKLTGHTIFCGFSRIGQMAAQELRRNGTQVVIIEANEQRANNAEEAGFWVIRGDATLDECLFSAGIERAGRLITLLPRDSDNLYVILTAKEVSSSLYVVSRAEDEVGEKRLKRAGADKVISTHRLAARKLADGLLRPNVTDFFEIAGTGDDGWKIEEIRVPPASPVCGQTLKALSLRQTARVGIAAVISPEGQLEVNPSGDTKVHSGSTLIAIGWKQDIAALENLVLADEASK